MSEKMEMKFKSYKSPLNPEIPYCYLCALLYFWVVSKRGEIEEPYQFKITEEVSIVCYIEDANYDKDRFLIWVNMVKAGKSTRDCYFSFNKEGW